MLDGLRMVKAFKLHLNTLRIRHDWVSCAQTSGAAKCRQRNVIKRNHFIIFVNHYDFECEKDTHLDEGEQREQAEERDQCALNSKEALYSDSEL